MRTSTLVLALALLGCTEKQPQRCDSDAADELVARLEAADPHERARIVEPGIAVVCTGPTLFFEDHYHGSRLTEVGLAAFNRACIAESAVDEDSQRVFYSREFDHFYDACGFARFGVVSRSEYRLQPSAHPFVWVAHQSMLDNGLSADQARTITRAWLLRDRAADSFYRLEDLRLPAIEGEREFEGLLVQISPSEIVVDERTVARLDEGELDDDASDALYREMEEYAYKQEHLARMWGQPPETSLVIAADIGTPRAMLSDVIFWASRIGYTRFVTLGEPQPFVYTAQPVFGPAARRRDY